MYSLGVSSVQERLQIRGHRLATAAPSPCTPHRLHTEYIVTSCFDTPSTRSNTFLNNKYRCSRVRYIISNHHEASIASTGTCAALIYVRLSGE